MSEQNLYFDHGASAPRLDEVAEAMAPWQHGVVGNPSGMHSAARAARRAIEDARDIVANFVGQPAHEVIFTAGGTESCHLAISGVVREHRQHHKVSDIVISPTEHHAVLNTALALADEFDDVRVRFLDVDDFGIVTTSSLWENVGPNTAIVSVMTVNNETGVYQPIPVVGSVTAGGVPDGGVSHTDAVAGAPWLYLPAMTESIDMISIAAHKLGGPVNSGALILRREIKLSPVSVGGGQERGHRGGTVDVAAAVGLAAACQVVDRERMEVNERVSALRVRLEAALRYIPGVAITATEETRVPGCTHLTVEGLASEELLFLLDNAGIAASAGASCSSGASVMSHVLEAMKMPEDKARGALRFTMGRETTKEDVDQLIAVFADVVYGLRGEK
ncbi:MAG: aminotransferase class V-fold PLP-dependent enzyme [Actinomycetes bacterium]|jgi:cysteine desulfurase